MTNRKNIGNVKEGSKATVEFELPLEEQPIKVSVSCSVCMTTSIKEGKLVVNLKVPQVEKALRFSPGYQTFSKTVSVTYKNNLVFVYTVTGKSFRK